MPTLHFGEGPDVSLEIRGAGVPVGVDAPHPRIARLRVGEGERESYFQTPRRAMADTLASRGPADALAAGFQLHLDARPFALELRDQGGARLIRLDLATLQRGADRRLGFEAVGEQHFYGLGHGGGGFDRLGTTRRFWNCHVNHGPGADIAIPLLVSSAGYGLFFDNPALAFLDPGPSGDTICFDYVTPCPAFDVYAFFGGSIAGVLELVAELLGSPPMPPRWALGYLQSTRHFEDRDELRRLLASFADKECRCDALILLSTYGEALGWNKGVGHLEVQPALFADAADLVGEVRQASLRVVTHEYPVLHPESGLHDEAEDKGFLIEAAYPDVPADTRTPVSYHEGQSYIGFARPEAGAWWWDRHRPLVDSGVDGWWLDGGEGPAEEEDLSGRHNSYDLMRQAAFAAGEARDRPERRPFLLCRSGGPGMQRTGAACWSGDVNASFTALEMQLALGLNVGLSGVPLWGTDIGGYYPTDPADPELFVRWFQFAAFTPIFRGHGRRWREHLPWSHGDEILAICRRYIELRYRLLPYTYSLCRQAYRRGLPLMRPLVLAYPDDPHVQDLANPYLWGPDLLVSPVTRAGVESWPVYLPEGRWYDFWSDREFEGGRSVAVPAPLDRMPLFARAGAILPLGLAPVRPDHRPAPMLDLTVYPGGESRFTLYEDDGETQAWRQGAYAETVIACTERAGETVVVIEPPAGDPAIVPERRHWRLRIRVSSPPAAVATSTNPRPDWRTEGSWVVLDVHIHSAEVRLRW
jgi:alpha-glucosidase